MSQLSTQQLEFQSDLLAGLDIQPFVIPYLSGIQGQHEAKLIRTETFDPSQPDTCLDVSQLFIYTRKEHAVGNIVLQSILEMRRNCELEFKTPFDHWQCITTIDSWNKTPYEGIFLAVVKVNMPTLIKQVAYSEAVFRFNFRFFSFSIQNGPDVKPMFETISQVRLRDGFIVIPRPVRKITKKTAQLIPRIPAKFAYIQNGQLPLIQSDVESQETDLSDSANDPHTSKQLYEVALLEPKDCYPSNPSKKRKLNQ